MANRFFVDGLTTNNWGDILNWSLTSGGVGGEAVPLATDDVFLDANSPNCILDTSNRVCRQFDATGYTNSLTFTFGLTATPQTTGVFKLAAGMTIVAGAGTLTITVATSGSATVTSAGIPIPCPLVLGGNGSTFTFTDNWDVNGALTLGGSNANINLSGNTINFSSDLTQQGTSATKGGTTTLVCDGTGTWTSGGSVLTSPLTINTAGTFTVSGTVRYNGSAITYTAGTVVTTGSTIVFINSVATPALNTGAVAWNNVTFTTANTYTFTGDFNVDGTLTVSTSTQTFNGGAIKASSTVTVSVIMQGTTELVLDGTGTLTTTGSGHLTVPVTINSAGTVTLSGTITFSADTFTYTAGTVVLASTPILLIGASTTVLHMNGFVWQGEIRAITAGVTVRLSSGLGIGGSGGKLTILGTVASPAVWNSTVGATQRALTIQPGAIIDVGHVSMTDLDASGGDELWVFKGSRSNCVNISAVTPYTSPLDAFVGGGGGGGAASLVNSEGLVG